MSDKEKAPRGKAAGGRGGVELRDEGLRHVVGAMPRGLLAWSAVALAVGVAVVVVVTVALVRIGVLAW